jgi:hypothetical protein
MPYYLYHSRKYLKGPKAGRVFRIHVYVGVYASLVLEAQRERSNRPITYPHGEHEDYNFRVNP